MWNNSPRNPYTASGVGAGALPMAGASTIQEASKTGLIITFALAQGLLVIAGICGYMGMQKVPPGKEFFRVDSESILFLAIGFGIFATNCVIAILLPMIMKRTADQSFRAANEPLPQPLNDDTTLPTHAQTALGAAMTRRIISQALLEGGAVLNAIFLFIEANLVFAIPVGVAVVGIAIQAPFASRLRAMLEDAEFHQ